VQCTPWKAASYLIWGTQGGTTDGRQGVAYGSGRLTGCGDMLMYVIQSWRMSICGANRRWQRVEIRSYHTALIGERDALRVRGIALGRGGESVDALQGPNAWISMILERCRV
jgi:hypothetical protein